MSFEKTTSRQVRPKVSERLMVTKQSADRYSCGSSLGPRPRQHPFHEGRRKLETIFFYTWKQFCHFFLSKRIFLVFFCRVRVFAKYGIFPTYGYAFFSTTCWKNAGLLRVSASTRIKYEPKYAYGHFFGTLRGLPIIDQKKCQYGFSGYLLGGVYGSPMMP